MQRFARIGAISALGLIFVGTLISLAGMVYDLDAVFDALEGP